MLRRLDKAFQAFFRRIRAGDKPGFPRFRSRDRYDSVTFPAYGDGCGVRENGKLYLQGVGETRVKWHRQIEGKIKTVTVRRRAGRWHVYFNVEYDPEPLPAVGGEVGINMGLEHFAALSTGHLVANPRWYKGVHRNGRRKGVFELQRVHEHVANQRADFVHKLSRRIARGYQLIAVEKLNTGGMSKGMLAKQVHDAGWRSSKDGSINVASVAVLRKPGEGRSNPSTSPDRAGARSVETPERKRSGQSSSRASSTSTHRHATLAAGGSPGFVRSHVRRQRHCRVVSSSNRTTVPGGCNRSPSWQSGGRNTQ